MNIASLLSTDRIECASEATSKKRLLETLANMLAKDSEDLNAASIFESLIQRERLGSTGIGHGVAIPHGRLADLDHAIGAVITLREGIDYDAPDKQPVDLLFALLVPEQSTDEHLQILSTLAQSFANEDTVEQLRQCQDQPHVLELTEQWQVQGAA